jgi:chromosome segregation ATPase
VESPGELAALKKRILELVRRDEEFRLALASAIGYYELLEEIRRLRREFNSMLKAFNKRFEALERKLSEHDKRFEAIEKKLLEHDRRFEAIERKLLEHDKRFEAIERKLLEHDKRLARIELELGAPTESFYSKMVWDELREELRGRGERITSRRRNFRIDESEIDLLVETDKRVYVVEVKVKPRHDDVGALTAKVDLARRMFPGKEVVGILAGAMIGGEIEKYAEEKGIKVYTY